MNYALCIMNYFVSLQTENLTKRDYEQKQTSSFDSGNNGHRHHIPVRMRKKYQRTGWATPMTV